MARNDDPKLGPPGGISADKGFVLAGLVALGVVLAIFMFIGRESPTSTASNGPVTTGAGSTSPPAAR